MLARDLRQRQVLGDWRLVWTQNGIELTPHLSLFLDADRVRVVYSPQLGQTPMSPKKE
jgi:hypothetical protein